MDAYKYMSLERRLLTKNKYVQKQEKLSAILAVQKKKTWKDYFKERQS